MTARWESSTTLDVPEGADREDLVDRLNAGNLDLLVELGDVDTVGAELVDWSAS